jgi:biotin operon repressor
VLETIFREGPVTRPELASRTGLSRPAVSAAVRRLEQAGLVGSAGARDGRRGRKPMSYGIGGNPSLVRLVRAAVAALLPLAARIETSRLGENASLYGAIPIALRSAHGQVFSSGLRPHARAVKVA